VSARWEIGFKLYDGKQVTVVTIATGRTRAVKAARFELAREHPTEAYTAAAVSARELPPADPG